MADRTQLYHSGCLTDGWRLFGAHPATENGVHGWWFNVWAPQARAVSVVGDFNGWDPGGQRPLPPRGSSGRALCRICRSIPAINTPSPERTAGCRYKADPYGFHTETRPGTASKLYDIEHFPWTDGAFRKGQAAGVPPAAEHLRGASRLLEEARKRRLSELPGSGASSWRPM